MPIAQVMDASTLKSTQHTLRATQRLTASCCCQTATKKVLGREFELLQSERPSKRVLVLETFVTEEELAGPWDFIFSARLFASLSDEQAQRLLEHAVKNLTPGGILLIANAKPKERVEICSACVGGFPFARKEEHLAMLASSIPDSLLAGQLVFGDEAGMNSYLELSAAPARISSSSVGVISTTIQ